MNNLVILIGGALLLGVLMRRNGEAAATTADWTVPVPEWAPTWEQYTGAVELAPKYGRNLGVY